MPSAAQPLGNRFQSVLVTGASSGIGKAVAEAFLRQGLTVYGTSRDPQKTGLNPAVRWLAFDGSNPAAVTRFMEEQSHLLSSVDVLINNAGSTCFGRLSNQSPTNIQGQLCLLLEAPARLTQTVLASMRERKTGAIVNISSLASSFPLPCLAVYSAGKSGLSTFTQSLILTEQDSGVTILDFQLGDFRTAFNTAMESGRPLDPEEQRVWERLERHLAAGPAPAKAATDLLEALRSGKSGVFRSGGFFQIRVAPLGLRLLPRSWLLGAIRCYYGLRAK